MAQALKNHILMQRFALIDSVFFLRSAQSGKKYTSGQFKEHNQKGNKGTRQMILSFHLLFPLEVFTRFIFVFADGQISVLCGPPFGQFVCKIPQFWAEATDKDSPS